MLLPQPDSPTRPTSSPGVHAEAHVVDGVDGPLLRWRSRREVADGEAAAVHRPPR